MTTVARGRMQLEQRGSARRRRAAAPPTLGDHHRVDARPACRGRAGRAPRPTASIVSRVPSIPILTASTPMSSTTARDLGDDHLRRDRLDRGHPDRVLRGERGDRVIPCTPQRANAFRSAWIPAPPPESEPAIVRHDRDLARGSHRRSSIGARAVSSARAARSARPSRARDQAEQLELGRGRRGPRAASPGVRASALDGVRARVDRARAGPQRGRAARRASAARRRRSAAARAAAGRARVGEGRARRGVADDAAPSRSRSFVPGAAPASPAPGTAPTSRPSSTPISAVISEPERSAASTTTVICAERRHDPVAGREAPSGTASRPGGSSETTSRRARRSARESRGGCAGRRRPARRRARRPCRAAASSAPAWAAASIPSAIPLTTVTPGGREPAAERRAHSRPYGEARARADDRHRRRRAEQLGERAAGRPRRCSDRRRVGQRRAGSAG